MKSVQRWLTIQLTLICNLGEYCGTHLVRFSNRVGAMKLMSAIASLISDV